MCTKVIMFEEAAAENALLLFGRYLHRPSPGPKPLVIRRSEISQAGLFRDTYEGLREVLNRSISENIKAVRQRSNTAHVRIFARQQPSQAEETSMTMPFDSYIASVARDFLRGYFVCL